MGIRIQKPEQQIKNKICFCKVVKFKMIYNLWQNKTRKDKYVPASKKTFEKVLRTKRFIDIRSHTLKYLRIPYNNFQYNKRSFMTQYSTILIRNCTTRDRI